MVDVIFGYLLCFFLILVLGSLWFNYGIFGLCYFEILD